MMTRPLTLVSLIVALSAPRAPAQVVEYAQAVRPAGFGEASPGLLSRPAEITVRGVSVAEALTQLSERARVPIAFSASLLPDRSHRVDCLCRTATVAEALDRLLAGTSLDFLEVHGQVVIFPRLRSGPEPARLAEWPPIKVDFAAMRPAGSEEPALGFQQPGTIRGRVIEARSERALSPAQVTIPGTSIGAVTDASGAYVMLNVPAGTHRVLARMIGFATAEQSVTVADGAVAQADFRLAVAAIQLDQVVVTGTGGPTSRRALGNAIATVNAADVVEKAVNTSVVELLQARAPGVTILQSSGSPGTAGNIRVRGITSLTSSSEPVFYVDGVRIHSGAGGSFRVNWQTTSQGQSPGGGQTASALDALNPEDIESIEVIKGPAAATLYGADAANGVIQILTKKGQAGDQKLQWHGKFQIGQSDWGLDRRTNFTTCDAVRLAQPAEWPGCQGRPVGTVLTETYLDDVVRGGTLRNAALSVAGGARGYSFYAAIDNDLEEGVFSNSTDERTSARANFALFPSDKVDFTVNLGYARSTVAFPAADNGPGVVEAAWTYQPGRRAQPGQERYVFDSVVAPERYEQYENQLEGDRVLLGTTVIYRPFSWFRNRLTVGGDVNSQRAFKYVPPGGLFEPKTGQANQGAPRNNVWTLDYAGTMEHRLPVGAGLPSAFSFGMQYTSNVFRNTVAQGSGFSSPLVKDVGSATTRAAWDEYGASKTLGFFAQEQVSWRERLYLTGAVRMDNSSVFGEEIDRLFYPKVSASYMISEEPFLRDRFSWLDNAKLRLAWGQAGNAPDALAKVTTYGLVQTVDPVTGQVTSALQLQTLANPRVKPERGSEVEAGLDASFLANRLGFEFTYYNKTTKDALMPVPVTPSVAGIPGGTQLRNVGEINNRGIELTISATPVQTERLLWESRFGLYTNRNELVSFGFDMDTILLGVTTANQRHVEGFPLAGFWVHDPVWDPAQNKYVAGPARYVGPSLPTREASLTNSLTLFGKLRLYALLDYKAGHYLLNQTDWGRCRPQAGVCTEVNDPGVSAERKAMLQADLTANDALYTQRADYIKVRDVSLTYTLPTDLSRRYRFDRVAITLAAHNVGYLWKPDYTGLDPDVTFNGINQPTGDGQTFGWVRMDLWTIPMLRRYTMSVDLSF